MPAGLHPIQPRQPIGLIVQQVLALVDEDRVDRRLWHRVRDVERWSDFDLGAGNGENALAASSLETRQERELVGEDAQLVAIDDVELKQVGVEERGRTCAGYHRARIDRLDVTHRALKLTGHLRVHQGAHPVGRLFVDHRVPNRAAVLQPVQVDRAMLA